MLTSDACVLHVVPANGGGVDRHVRDLCSLRRADLILHVADAQLVLELRDPQRFLPIDRNAEAFASIAGAIDRPALVHAHSTLGATRDAVAALRDVWGCPYVLTLHDIIFAQATDAAESSARGAFVNAAAACIAPSGFIASLFDENRAAATAPAEVIENGVDCPAQHATAPGTLTPPGKFAVAVVGALGDHKGLNFLLEVVAELPAATRVVLIGYADGQLSQDWMIPDRLWVHGAFETLELAELLDAYGVELVFFPNRQPESFSYTLSDVWCAGRTVLVPAAGALAERVARAGVGTIYPVDATATAAAGIIGACLAAEAPVGARVPETELSVRDMVSAVEALYSRVLGDQALPPANVDVGSLPVAAHLDSAFFRAELRKLAADLEFSSAQNTKLMSELAALHTEYAQRGDWIAKLDANIAELQQEIARLGAREIEIRAQLSGQLDAQQRQIEKLNRDVIETLAIAHHYERALAQIPRPLRRWLLQRTARNLPPRAEGENTSD